MKELFLLGDDPSMKKWYGLVAFPYPSGQGLHVGHPRSYTALDIIARKKGWKDIMYYILMGWMLLAHQQNKYANQKSCSS